MSGRNYSHYQPVSDTDTDDEWGEEKKEGRGSLTYLSINLLMTLAAQDSRLDVRLYNYSDEL